MLIAAPAVALVMHERGILPEQAHVRMLADQVEVAWHDVTTQPLRYVGGDLADGVLTYVHSRPELLPNIPEWHAKRVREFGIAFVCFADDAECITASSNIADRNPASRKIETRLVRNYLGIPGHPRDYAIFIVPPETSSPQDEQRDMPRFKKNKSSL
jgi:hypothetical protein